MVAAETWAPTLSHDMSDEAIRAVAFRAGPDTVCDASLLAAGNAAELWSAAALARLIDQAKNFRPPHPPIAGSDLLALGMTPGQKLGATLDQLIDHWIASDFTLTKQALLASLADRATDG
jgi:poly(A) polymerase